MEPTGRKGTTTNHGELARLFPLLMGSLIAMLVGLVGLVLLLARGSGTLTQVHEVIVGDTAPSVVELEAASVRLSRLEGLLRDRMRASPDALGVIDVEIDATRRDLRDYIRRYVLRPDDPSEAEVRLQLAETLDRFEVVADRIRNTTESTVERNEELSHTLDHQVSQLNSVLFAAASLNADMLMRASGQLLTMRNGLLPGVLALETLCVLATSLSLLAAYRVVRTAAASGAESRRQLELRMVELEAFAGRVAHDLLSPLMSVSLALGAAEPYLATSEHGRIHSMVARAAASLSRVRQTVSDLLDFARAGASPPQNARADAPAVLREVADDFEPIAESARVELRVEVGSSRAVRCSAGVLRSVLANLVQNAIKYIDGGEERRVTVRSAELGSDVRFEVEDTGPGIRADDQVTIFEPYVRRSDHGAGLGLGLATVRRLVEAHGGQVGVCSEPGRGSRFWAVLPGVS
ncbi:histidine kinase [Minicystis rosea]|nr:histidine kinase [Minicystis rosea]